MEPIRDNMTDEQLDTELFLLNLNETLLLGKAMALVSGLPADFAKTRLEKVMLDGGATAEESALILSLLESEHAPDNATLDKIAAIRTRVAAHYYPAEQAA